MARKTSRLRKCQYPDLPGAEGAQKILIQFPGVTEADQVVVSLYRKILRNLPDAAQLYLSGLRQDVKNTRKENDASKRCEKDAGCELHADPVSDPPQVTVNRSRQQHQPKNQPKVR